MRTIKRILAGVILAMAGLCAQAQPAGYTKLESKEEFKNNMLATAKDMTTLQSDFKQVKHIAGMTKDIEQTGRFYFKKEDKLLLEYLTPMKSTICMNGNKIQMKSGGKSTSMDAGANPAVGNLKKMLSETLSGSLPENSKSMELTIYANADNYLVYVVGKDGNMAKKMERIEVMIRKSDYAIMNFKMIEKKKPNAKEADYMEFAFTNMQRNAAIDDAKFNQ